VPDTEKTADEGLRMTLDELDGVTAAPGNHSVLFENDQVRVIETRIAAGELTPLHTHLAPTVMYVLSGSHFIRRDENGATMVDTRATPDFVLAKVSYSAGTPRHTIENTGDDELHVIGVELKHPLGS
jgi:hypothetical protein